MVPKFLGVGLNYRDHAGNRHAYSEAPIVFARPRRASSAPTMPILIPKGWQRIDFEVELAFAIRQPGEERL